jgi:hypothetical protein
MRLNASTTQAPTYVTTLEYDREMTREVEPSDERKEARQLQYMKE